MKIINGIVLGIAIIGCVNWGLIALFEFDLTMLSKIVYGLVGLCGLYLLTFYGKLSDR